MFVLLVNKRYVLMSNCYKHRYNYIKSFGLRHITYNQLKMIKNSWGYKFSELIDAVEDLKMSILTSIEDLLK